MEENRLFRFKRPEWMNGANARSAGVYASGAIVSACCFVICHGCWVMLAYEDGARDGRVIRLRMDWGLKILRRVMRECWWNTGRG